MTQDATGRQQPLPDAGTGNRQGIRVEGLCRYFQSGEKRLTVFENLNFQIPAGERVALIGASGAGKSSLLYCLGALDRASAGKIYFGNQEIQELTDNQLADFRNRQLGFVWQIHYLLPEFTALENVMMPLLVRGTEAAEAESSAVARLTEVGLAERLTHRAGELSGGEQQRVVLARALVGRPQYLFADEPTGNLDEKTGAMITGLMREMHQQHGLTSFYVTHNTQFAHTCDRVFRLQNGEIADITQRGT